MDFETIVFEGLKQFPTVQKKIEHERVSTLVKEDPESLLLVYVAKSLPDAERVKRFVKILEENPNHLGAIFGLYHLLNPFNTMMYLDACMSEIQDNEKLNASMEHLLKSDAFWQGYCEIEVAANIKRIFGKVELEPSLGNERRADAKFIMGSKEVFIEVTAPKRHYKYVKLMEESAREHKAIQLEAQTERASDKILKELEHFADLLDKVHSVIIINLNETDIDDIDIEDALMGVSKLVVITERTTGKVETKVVREDWTTFSRDAKLAKVGAVICYKRDFALNGKVAYKTRVFALGFDKTECELLLRLFPDR